MSLVVNNSTIPELVGKVKHNGRNILLLKLNNTTAWSIYNTYNSGDWSMSSCADQGPAYNKTFTDTDMTKFDLDTNGIIDISNNGLICKSSVSSDVNNICRTYFIFSLFGKTYKVVNETSYRYIMVKDNGTADSTYTSISGGAIKYNDYTYLTINLGLNTSVVLGTNGQFDLSKIKDLLVDGSILYRPIQAYGQNFHYAGCTAIDIYEVRFT